ncbi:MAG TPA: HemK/PrmC family methyltransferase [Candidatus Saccharimonadales bacterium]|nr:HemK/PrmC family methyltransferase [Candidatus Saccharimonadales bacterium]
MKVDKWLASATAELEEAGVSSARLDCLILLEDMLGKDRGWILAHPETELNREQINKLSRQVARRSRHVPMAQIRGFTEFYGRKFLINKYVLEPRPESETMIELLKILKLPKKPAIADVGTGSGALGITAALEIPQAIVDLYDIDSNCLAVAKNNCALHELRLHARKSNLLNRGLRSYDVVLANLPYVPDDWQINEAAAMEPRIAIFGGKDGLDHYRRLFKQLRRQHQPPRFVLTEALPPQHAQLASIAQEYAYQLRAHQDFIQVFVAD